MCCSLWRGVEPASCLSFFFVWRVMTLCHVDAFCVFLLVERNPLYCIVTRDCAFCTPLMHPMQHLLTCGVGGLHHRTPRSVESSSEIYLPSGAPLEAGTSNSGRHAASRRPESSSSPAAAEDSADNRSAESKKRPMKKSNNVCWHFRNGHCRLGEKCRWEYSLATRYSCCACFFPLFLLLAFMRLSSAFSSREAPLAIFM